jgi:hypothetical protein
MIKGLIYILSEDVRTHGKKGAEAYAKAGEEVKIISDAGSPAICVESLLTKETFTVNSSKLFVKVIKSKI